MILKKFKIDFTLNEKEYKHSKDINNFSADVCIKVDDKTLFESNIFILDLYCQLGNWIDKKDDFVYDSDDDAGMGLAFINCDNYFLIKSDWSNISEQLYIAPNLLVNSIKNFLQEFEKSFYKKFGIKTSYFINKFYCSR